MSGAIPINTWKHFVGVCDRSSGTQTISLRGYNDGKHYASWGTSTSYNLSNNYRLTFGAYQHEAQYFYKDSIDEVRIYNRALSDQEILDIYNYDMAARSKITKK